MDVRDDSSSNIRIVMLPWLAYGHISPYLELAKKLTERNFNIYLCSTPVILSSIKNKVTEKYSLSIQLVELHLPSLPELPPHYHTTNGLPPNLIQTLETALDMASPGFSNILKTVSPDLVIYDFQQPWAPEIASSLNIPAVHFQITGAVPFSFGMHLFKRGFGVKFPFPEIYSKRLDGPLPPAPPSGGHDASNDDVEGLLNAKNRFLGAAERSCNIVLVKSSREIEGKYLDYVGDLLGKKMVPVGHLVEQPIITDNDKDAVEIIKWLDNKERSSTVFVSFGSECFLSKEQILEVAYGLELSNVNFIWVLRLPMEDQDQHTTTTTTTTGTSVEDQSLPVGFLERVGVGQRGFVARGWAPQSSILRHPSTGGFLSHCGTSSLTESMSCGVPIIAMPIRFDHPLNARLVVDLGVSVELDQDDKGRGVKRDQIATKIRKVMVDKDGDHIRSRARELSERLRMKEDAEIEGVVEELSLLCRERETSK